jgi:hypothetical protein
VLDLWESQEGLTPIKGNNDTFLKEWIKKINGFLYQGIVNIFVLFFLRTVTAV